jgi:phage gpG-like protein
MASDIVIHVEGTAAVVDLMDGLATRVEDLTPAWQEIHERFVEYEESWFQSEGNGSWPQLSHDYAEWKHRHFPGEPILVRTGRLRDTATEPDIFIAEANRLILGTSDPVAAAHQEGRGHLPVRKVIDVDDTEIDEWTEIIKQHILEGDL